MGLDFSALMRYAGRTPQVVRAIGRLELVKVYLPLQPVIEYGQEQDRALGTPRDAHWYDVTHRPYSIYHAEPIRGLTG